MVVFADWQAGLCEDELLYCAAWGVLQQQHADRVLVCRRRDGIDRLGGLRGGPYELKGPGTIIIKSAWVWAGRLVALDVLISGSLAAVVECGPSDFFSGEIVQQVGVLVSVKSRIVDLGDKLAQ